LNDFEEKTDQKEGYITHEISLESKLHEEYPSNFHHLKARNNIKSYRKIC
jgi:hypothetical protein